MGFWTLLIVRYSKNDKTLLIVCMRSTEQLTVDLLLGYLTTPFVLQKLHSDNGDYELYRSIWKEFVVAY
jgi:hypothetical protein